MRYPRLTVGHRSPSAAVMVVLVAAAAIVATWAGGAAASAQAAPPVPTESALVHRLATCRAPRARPVVVLVHGAWADASSWSGEVRTLQAAGYDVRAIPNPVENLTTDSEFVADYLKTIHGLVVLVGPSYGGSVITSAAAGLANVKALVYVDAAAPAPGETNGQLSGAGSVLAKKKPAQLSTTTTYPNAPNGASELYLKEDIFIHNFASDLPRSEAKLLWASQSGASTAAFNTPSKAAAWKTIPSWYFISTGDQIITSASELAMAHRAHSHITVFRGGSPLTLISPPNAVTAVIASAVCSQKLVPASHGCGSQWPSPRSRISAAPRTTHRSGSSTTAAGMPVAASILLARPGSRAPPPARRILPRTTSSAAFAGMSDIISCTKSAIVPTGCSSAEATSHAGTCSTRGVRRAESMPTVSTHSAAPSASPRIIFRLRAALRPVSRPNSALTACTIASSMALPPARSDPSRTT